MFINNVLTLASKLREKLAIGQNFLNDKAYYSINNIL